MEVIRSESSELMERNAIVSQEHQYKSYGRRWIILAIVCLLNFSNAMLWISFAPIANFTDEYYCEPDNNATNSSSSSKTSCDAANYLSLVFMIVSIPLGFLAMFSVDKYGLRSGILLGSWVNAVGAILRLLSSFDFVGQSAKFAVVMIGQTISACAQPFIMFLPPKLAAYWFAENQRAIANTLGSMSNPLGIMVVMLISPQIVRKVDDMWILNLALMVPSVTAAILGTVCVCSGRPPHPPSPTANQSAPAFWPGLKAAVRHKSFIILVICLGGGMGLFNGVYTLIQQIMCPRGYSNKFSGLCGALLIAGGIIGAVIAGIIVDRTRLFEEITKVAFGLAAIFAAAFSVLSLHENVGPWIAISVTLFGAGGFAVYPLGLELGVEITYPVAEATSTGLIIISGQVQGIIYVLLMSALARDVDKSNFPNEKCSVQDEGASVVQPQDMLGGNLLWAGVTCVVSCLYLLLFWPRYRRIEMEKKLRKIGNEPMSNENSQGSSHDTH